MASLVAQIVLFIWFLGCTISYRTSKWTLVDGMGIRSAEFVMLSVYSVGVFLHQINDPFGKWFLLVVLLAWIIVQFFCHWYFTIFGVSEKKLKGYNECFKNTIRLIPASDTRLIPDLYHIILHLLIIANIVMLFF